MRSVSIIFIIIIWFRNIAPKIRGISKQVLTQTDKPDRAQPPALLSAESALPAEDRRRQIPTNCTNGFSDGLTDLPSPSRTKTCCFCVGLATVCSVDFARKTSKNREGRLKAKRDTVSGRDFFPFSDSPEWFLRCGGFAASGIKTFTR